jgi:hypothetical protein
VHARQARKGGLRDEEVHGLGLADVRPAVRGEVDDRFLGQVPHGLVEVLQVRGDLGDGREAAVRRDDAVLEVGGPEPAGEEVADEPRVEHRKLAGEGAARVQVAGLRLEALAVAQELARGRGGHGRDAEAVPQPGRAHAGPERVPVVHVAGRHAPEVEL